VRLAGGASSAPGLGSALVTSLLTASISATVITVLGVPLAYLLAHGRGALTRLLTALVALPLALPPLMSGLLLLYVVGPYTTAGRLFGGNLTDTRVGIVLAQTFVAAPFLVIVARAAFAAVDPTLEEVAATLGHGRLARFRLVAVPAALPGIGAGVMLAWLRAFGEFGATVILAYHPYSLPVLTFVQFDATGLPATMLPIAAALAAALVILLLVQFPPRRRGGKPSTASARADTPPLHFELAQAAAPARADAPAPLHFALAKRLGAFSLDLSHQAHSSRLALLGPSGAGKTLTLRLLAGLTPPARGSYVQSGGLALQRLPAEQRRIGYVPQQSALFPRRTIWRQVTFGARAQPALAAWWIERLGLKGLEDRYPHELSGGQQRRVALARALAIAPRVLLLDEPFTGLDVPVREGLRRELRRLQREVGLSTVIVTHDPQEAAMLAEEILVIDDGRILQAGARETVFAAPCSPQVAGLLGIVNTHAGVIVASDRLLSGASEISIPTSELAEGTKVTWCVRPEQILVKPDGPYTATLLDEIDLGSVRELTISLDQKLELIVRTSQTPELNIGDAMHFEMSPEGIAVWPVADRELAQKPPPGHGTPA
jgi:ABC-type sulfate/molybdate transport systems ATPase subunit/ABC-type sulfate transport system permease component